MKKIFTYFLIICLMFSVLPIGIEHEWEKYDSGKNTAPVQFSETTIDMSTACRPVREMCKLLTLMKTQAKPTDFTPVIIGKFTGAKRTQHRKIITFESNGEIEDPSR